MKAFHKLLPKALVFGVFLLGFATATAMGGDTVPQAKPVITLLKAVKEGDQKQLQSAFSEKIRAQYEKVGWDKVLQQHQEGFQTAFGDYTLDDFTYEYKGDKEKGGVSVVHKDKPAPTLSVIKEDAEWKLNER